MPARTIKTGPGSLTIGEAGTDVDVSCQILDANVTSDVSADDPTEVLCGDTVPGDVTYADKLNVTALQDYADASGLSLLSWRQRGTVVPFSFVPSTSAGVTISGSIRLDPTQLGGEVGTRGEWSQTFDGVGPFAIDDGDGGTFTAPDVVTA